MKAALIFLVLISCIACERKPTPEELEQQRALEERRNSPTPKPGDWMWKKYQNPLEPPKH